ncbi:TPA: adenine deaminase [Candidatus Avigastranaerophilus faecigallinarum]|nr:adenine deaminase [Candidatus Avigastranaerophilus faecigallinarum]
MSIEEIIKTAKGSEKADLIIRNGQIINVLSEEIYQADIAIKDGIIAGIGNNYKGKNEIDANGKFISPSFIDGHVHIESSMLLPSEFAKMVVPTGTTTIVADPHEISNVIGLHGISFMREVSKDLPLDVYMTLPSCVPATPYETSGFELNSYDLSLLIDSPWVLGLAEMMNYPGVVNLDKEVLAKIKLALEKRKRIDGHAPYLSGKDLCAYVAAGVSSDHECTNPSEAIEKLRLGMYLMVREGSAAKDLDALIPVLKEFPTRKCIFVTDDRYPSALKEHINMMVRRAVEKGINPIKAIQMASINTAEYFGLKNLGAIAPGYKADLLLLDNLENFKPQTVIKNGNIVAQNGKMTINIDSKTLSSLRGTVNIRWLEKEDIKIKALSNKVKTIEVTDGQLVTKCIEGNIDIQDGYVQSNLDEDILKILVIERHKASGNIGKGFVKGFGLKSGAIASTVAHDSHNMIVIGTNDDDMFKAIKELVKSQGGKVIVKDGEVLAKLELPIAGIMSEESSDTVIKKSEELKKAEKLIGCKLQEPFMTMAFLSLSVIPEIKLTDKGLMDVVTNEFTDLFITKK